MTATANFNLNFTDSQARRAMQHALFWEYLSGELAIQTERLGPLAGGMVAFGDSVHCWCDFDAAADRLLSDEEWEARNWEAMHGR